MNSFTHPHSNSNEASESATEADVIYARPCRIILSEDAVVRITFVTQPCVTPTVKAGGKILFVSLFDLAW